MNARIAVSLCLLLTLVPLGGAHLTNPYGSQTSGLLTGHNCRYGGSGPYAPDADDGTLLWPVKDGMDEFIYPKVDKEDGPDSGEGGCDETRPNNAGGVNPPTWLNSGVSGTYLAGSTAQAGGDALPLVFFPLVTGCPVGYCNPVNVLCDMEVLGQGGALGDLLTGDPKDDPSDGLLNEPIVDREESGGVAGSGLPGIGPVIGLGLWQEIYKDGTVDDGGIGGACHTSGYANDDPACTIDNDPCSESYNTYGCHGTSHAEDAASGANVWIGAGCDFYSTIGKNCVGVLRGAALSDCTDSITCNIPPETCTPDFVGCGPDGTTDEINLGEGGGTYYFAHPGESDTDQEKTGPLHFLHPLLDGKKKVFQHGQGVQYPIEDDMHNCSASGATAVTYVLQGVDANAGDIIMKILGDSSHSNGKQSYPNNEYTLAVGGWIDWTNDNTGGNFRGREPKQCLIERLITKVTNNLQLIITDVLTAECDGKIYTPEEPGDCKFSGTAGTPDRTVECSIGSCEKQDVTAIANLKRGATSVSTDILCGTTSMIGGPLIDNLLNNIPYVKFGIKEKDPKYTCVVRFVWNSMGPAYEAEGVCRHRMRGDVEILPP